MESEASFHDYNGSCGFSSPGILPYSMHSHPSWFYQFTRSTRKYPSSPKKISLRLPLGALKALWGKSRNNRQSEDSQTSSRILWAHVHRCNASWATAAAYLLLFWTCFHIPAPASGPLPPWVPILIERMGGCHPSASVTPNMSLVPSQPPASPLTSCHRLPVTTPSRYS